MRWLELTVQTHPEAVESVSELLSSYAPGGVAIEEPIELIDEGQEYRVLHDRPVQVHAYLPIDGSEEQTRQRIAEGLWHLSSLGSHFVGELHSRVVNEEDWANAWKDYYHVTHIGRRLVIRPSWREYTPRDDEVVLELDPGMAFGTGLHPTTRMCLEQVERLTCRGMRVLDVGTGSGILALAAAKLGASEVYCIDNSSVAVESAIANAAANNLGDRITVVLGVLDENEAQRLAGQFDLVLANIIARVIGSIAPQLAHVLKPDGLLITSGIIEERRYEAEQPLLSAGLQLVDQVMIDDWVTLVMKK
ncbi:MAG TPA: 50S ribosomal protein L11 methyltransferase [Ktedonobacteraceae bacterium]|jgi:ribosomal protein L11 methyltransferase|nr:50S ribosomal protein L11 methyltransferase [Ktedonobacteraceae bacterium]